MSSRTFRVAAVQASPVFLDRDATIEKACTLIAEAAREGARLVAFPEAFVPGYPMWVWALAPGDFKEQRALYAQLALAAVTVPSDATARLAKAARDASVYVVIGINERNAEASGTSLYNSLLFLDDRGEILSCHRKLIPTSGERLVWAQGDGSTLRVHDTPLGKLSGLICWENYMPLARYALYAWGAQIHVAATWDRGEPWLSTLRHIAKEGHVYVLGTSSAMRLEDIPERFAFRSKLTPNAEGWIHVGDTTIVDPDGQIIAGPLKMQEAIAYADVDPQVCLASRLNLDVAGHYARPDVFQLTVDRTPCPMIREAVISDRHGQDVER